MALPSRVPCKRDKGDQERDGEGPETATAGSDLFWRLSEKAEGARGGYQMGWKREDRIEKPSQGEVKTATGLTSLAWG